MVNFFLLWLRENKRQPKIEKLKRKLNVKEIPFSKKDLVTSESETASNPPET